METLNISISVNVDLTDGTKNFLRELFNKQVSEPATGEKPSVKDKEKPVTAVEEKQVALAEEKPKKTKSSAKKEQPNNAVSIDDIRAAVIEKINDHREVIKQKLTDYGVPNVTKLQEENYAEFFNFLKSL